MNSAPLVLAGFSLFACTSCNWLQERSSQQPAVILIAIESLNFEMASCLEDYEEQDGFDDLCREALRFTHFYTNSPMSQSSLASLFTGMDASEHGVFTNGHQGIPHTITTLAEKALTQGFRTSFLSGGPPILAKSGLHQGFEDFDDDFLREGRIYKPVLDNFRSGLQILTQNTNQPSFLSIYVPDLQFTFVGTFSDEGQEREKSLLAQKQEVGESLRWFFNALKKEKIWDDAYIVVLGLNGDASASRKNVLWHENLFRENIHMPLFIKMPRTTALESMSFDSLVSTKELGLLIQEAVLSKSPQSVVSFLSQWKDQPDRLIETRSDWRNWWFHQPVDRAIRTYDYLIFDPPKMSVYHTLVDKGESVPLTRSQVGRENLRWLEYFKPNPPLAIKPGKNEEPAAAPPAEISGDLYGFLQFLHGERQARNTNFMDNLSPAKGADFSIKVSADRALRDKNWPFLEIYSEEIPMRPSCDRLFHGRPKPRDYRLCRDPLFMTLLDWEKKFGDESSTLLEKTFIRKFRYYMKEKQMAYINLFLELNWDVEVRGLIGPSLSELYLSQASKAHLRKKIEEYKVPLTASFP